MTHEQMIAIDKFSKALLDCLENKAKNEDDALVRIGLRYAINLILLHITLAELDRNTAITREVEALQKEGK